MVQNIKNGSSYSGLPYHSCSNNRPCPYKHPPIIFWNYKPWRNQPYTQYSLSLNVWVQYDWKLAWKWLKSSIFGLIFATNKRPPKLIYLRAKFWWLAWLGAPWAGPALWNYLAPLYSRHINNIRQKDSVTNFWILIISIHPSRFGNRIKYIWQPLLFINGYLRMEYNLFQAFARKIPRPVPPTGCPGPASQAVHQHLATGPKRPERLLDWIW